MKKILLSFILFLFILSGLIGQKNPIPKIKVAPKANGICGDPIIDSRDGRTYNTVQIGTQCWMAENLNIGTMIDGTQNMSDDGSIEKYCYNNEEDSCLVYGGLYQWNEMMQYNITTGVQGICPLGWHLPTDAEWCTLENEVDAGTVSCTIEGWRGVDAGLNLKSTTGWYSGLNGTDLYGFAALTGGMQHSNGSFDFLLWLGFFWSSSEYDSSKAWSQYLDYSRDDIARPDYTKIQGFSVRCMQY